MKKFLLLLSFLLFTGRGSKIEYQNIDVLKMNEMLKEEKVTILDVRSHLEFSHGHIENAINVDVDDILENVEDLIPNKDKKIIVYCQSGNRSVTASKRLNELGYKNIYNLLGGFNAYQEARK